MSQQMKDIINENGEYCIPCTWEMYGTVQIYGVNNLQEAYDVAQKYIDDLPLPTDGEYINASYELETAEDIIITAQDNYYRHNAYFVNPESKH